MLRHWWQIQNMFSCWYCHSEHVSMLTAFISKHMSTCHHFVPFEDCTLHHQFSFGQNPGGVSLDLTSLRLAQGIPRKQLHSHC